jgi:PAS domain S-box-containing protein
MENVLVNMGLVHFVRLAEFGFAVLVGVMTFELLRQLRETQRTTQAILDNVPAWIYVKDLHGRYLLSNRRYEDAVHATPGSMLGKTDYEFFPEPEADAKRTADQEVLARRQAPEFEEISTPNGSYLSWRYPLIDFAGVPYAICGIATDISALRQAQHETEALRQQVWHDDRVERAGVLLASLAHELAQPLTAILHNGQAGRRFLAQPDPDLKMIRAILTDIVRDAGRTSSLIGRLRAMLRRQQDQPRERVDLSDCVAEVIELVRNDLRLRHVQVSLAAPEPHVVVASKTQIQQVLLNLLLNGAEAMANLSPDQRRLSISLSSDGTRETVAVRDCGSGFPREDLDKVFDNFYTTKSQGLGMGLAVCRSIIESHSGKIWAEFNENAGTTFFFSLPT